jgi:hypothetical protein
MTEIEEFSDLVGSIYDAALNRSLWPSVLESVCRAVPAACANLFTQDSVNIAANSLSTWGMDPVYFRLYLETYVRYNPMFPAAYFHDVGQIFTPFDVVPEGRMARTARRCISPPARATTTSPIAYRLCLALGGRPGLPIAPRSPCSCTTQLPTSTRHPRCWPKLSDSRGANSLLFAIVEVGAIAEASELLGLSQTTVKTHLRASTRKPT